MGRPEGDGLRAAGKTQPAVAIRRSPHARLPAFMADFTRRDALAARALEFLILTNVRTDAVLKARWDEFDLDQAMWTVPLANLKDRKHRKEGFRVPLSARAVEIVRGMQAIRVSQFVFPGQRTR